MINQMKKKLDDGQVVVGSFVYIPSAKLTEIIAMTGFDFVVIDMEHGPVDIGAAENMVRAAELAGVTPIIRVTHNSPHLLLRALDIGAQAVHIPDINTAADACAAVAACKYGPEGERGLAGVRALGYGLQGPIADKTETANRETMVIAHIEHIDAVNNLDKLLAVEGIDIYYLGPVDLSNSLGIPGRVGDSRVQELVTTSIRRIAEAGKIPGCITVDSEAAKRFIDLGVRYIASHAIKCMTNASTAFLEEIRS